MNNIYNDILDKLNNIIVYEDILSIRGNLTKNSNDNKI